MELVPQGSGWRRFFKQRVSWPEASLMQTLAGLQDKGPESLTWGPSLQVRLEVRVLVDGHIDEELPRVGWRLGWGPTNPSKGAPELGLSF